MVSQTIIPTDEWTIYDRVADVTASGAPVFVTVGDETIELPGDLVDALRQSAEFLARDKAVVITPRSRLRFV
ncbi:MAG: hypothetical protein ACP5OV_03450 [Acidimicrobiales bacterium]